MSGLVALIARAVAPGIELALERATVKPPAVDQRTSAGGHWVAGTGAARKSRY